MGKGLISYQIFNNCFLFIVIGGISLCFFRISGLCFCLFLGWMNIFKVLILLIISYVNIYIHLSVKFLVFYPLTMHFVFIEKALIVRILLNFFMFILFKLYSKEQLLLIILNILKLEILYKIIKTLWIRIWWQFFIKITYLTV